MLVVQAEKKSWTKTRLESLLKEKKTTQTSHLVKPFRVFTSNFGGPFFVEEEEKKAILVAVFVVAAFHGRPSIDS